MKKNQVGLSAEAQRAKAGEIATIITLATFIIIGISSLASSFFLKNKQTTTSKAAGKTNCAFRDYQECNETYKCTDCKACDDTTYECLGTSQQGQTSSSTSSSSNSTDLVAACKCVNGKAAGDCPVNPCGPIPETKSAPNDSPSCSNWGQWADRCSGTSEGCLSDAGGTYTYWCDGKDWRFQYANCVSWCQVDYLQKPPSKKDPLCEKSSTGDFVTDQYNTSLPAGTEKGDAKGVEVPEGFKYVSCDGNVGVWVEVQPFCDQFGQIGWAPGRTSKKPCTPPDIATVKAPGSFTLNLNIYVTKTAKGFDFMNEAKVYSNNCDGDLRFSRDGAFVNMTGWNRAVKGDTFTWPKDNLGVVSIVNGDSRNVTFETALLNCPRSKVPITDTVICNFGVSPYGIPWVRGAGCTLKNFDEVQKMTRLTTPAAKQGKPVTWGAPPAPKISSPGIIYKSNVNKSTTSPPAAAQPPAAQPTAAPGGTTPAPRLGPGAITSRGATPAPTTVSTNRCPLDKGATCSFLSCGTNFVEIGQKCINEWDKCCVPNDPQVIAQFPTIAPTTEIKTVRYDFPAGAVPQIFTMGDLRTRNVCDYYGIGNLGLADVRNCYSPNKIEVEGNKVAVTYSGKVNQKQLLCKMNFNVGVIKIGNQPTYPNPLDCWPLN